MGWAIITGKIVLSNNILDDNLIHLAYFLTQKAIDNKIGINLNHNLTDFGRRHYPIQDYISKGYIPYEIIDDPLSCECHLIFENMGYHHSNYQVNTRRTKLYKVQKFYEDIVTHELISCVTAYFEDQHKSVDSIVYEYEITANMLCEAFENTPNAVNHLEIPSAIFTIRP